MTSLILSVGCEKASEDGAVGPTDSTEPPVDDVADWSASNVVDSGADGVGLYFIGRHRPLADGSGYEATPESFHVDLAGETTAISAPPVDLGVGPWSVGVATGESIYVMVRDCEPGGDPTSAGFGCGETAGHQFLRYDVTRDEWTRLDLPPGIEEAAGTIRRVPGQVVEGGPILFGLPSANYGGAVSNQIAAFDPQTEDWSLLLDEPRDLPSTCTDGSAVYHFDGQQLLETFASYKATPPDQATVTMTLDLHVTRTAGEPDSVESVQVVYPVPEGFEVTDVLGVEPVCMADGSLLITVPLGLADTEVPWQLRSPDGSWTSVIPDPLLKEGLGRWQGIGLEGHVIFATTESTSSRPAILFDLASRSWKRLSDLPPAVIPHQVRRAGPTQAADLPLVPTLDRVPTILEAS